MSRLQQIKGNALFSNSLFIFLTRFFPSLASTIALIIFSRNLDESTYGLYQNFWIQLNVLFPIACFGIHVLLITYSPAVMVRLMTSLQAKHYIIYSIWILTIGSIFALLQFRSLELHFIVPLFFLISYTLSFILESTLIVFKSFKALVSISFSYSLIFTALHWAYLHYELPLQVLFLSLLLITSIRLLLYAFISNGYVKRYMDTPLQNITLKEVRSLWLHLGLYDVLQVLFSWIDKFIMSLILIASLSAIYYNGAMNIPFLPLILSAAGSAILIQLSTVSREDELAHTLRLLNQSARMLSCIVFPLFLFLLFFRYELFSVLLSDKYLASVPVFLVSILVLPLRAYSFTTVLQNQHKGAIINIGAILDIALACLLIYPLYKWLGLPGVALAFVITTYLQAAYYMYHTARVLQVKMPALLPYKNWLFKLIIFAIAFITIHYLLTHLFKPAVALISGAVLSAIIVLISLWVELKAYRRKYGKALS